MVSLSNHERTSLPPSSPELAQRLSAHGFLYNSEALLSLTPFVDPTLPRV